MTTFPRTMPSEWRGSELDWERYVDGMVITREKHVLVQRLMAMTLEDRRICWKFARDLLNSRGYALKQENMSPNPSDWTLDWMREVLWVHEHWESVREAEMILATRSKSNGQR